VSVSLKGRSDPIMAFSYPNYKDFRDRNQVLSGLLVYRFAPISLSREGNNERIWGYEVSGNYFEMLGVPVIKGRTLLPEDDRAAFASPGVGVRYGAGGKGFGAGPSVVGEDVLLSNHSFKIIGIGAKGFKGAETIYTPEIWVPITMLEWVEPGARWLENRRSANM